MRILSLSTASLFVAVFSLEKGLDASNAALQQGTDTSTDDSYYSGGNDDDDFFRLDCSEVPLWASEHFYKERGTQVQFDQHVYAAKRRFTRPTKKTPDENEKYWKVVGGCDPDTESSFVPTAGPTVDPTRAVGDCSFIDEWNKKTFYKRGDEVVFESKVYSVTRKFIKPSPKSKDPAQDKKRWQLEEECDPDTVKTFEPTSAPTDGELLECGDIRSWSNRKKYKEGDEVLVFGYVYEAINDVKGGWGPVIATNDWEYVGQCNSLST